MRNADFLLKTHANNSYFKDFKIYLLAFTDDVSGLGVKKIYFPMHRKHICSPIKTSISLTTVRGIIYSVIIKCI